jgi:hypothetical protein
MNHWKAPYNEETELTEYIWHSYSHLLSEREELAARAILADRKAASSGAKMSAMLRKHWGDVKDPQLADLLGEGNEAFRKRVRERILNESADKVIINRCSECDRIVATPRAEQCLWCGHDWH